MNKTMKEESREKSACNFCVLFCFFSLSFRFDFLFYIYPAFRTAPVQLNDAAAVPVVFALYGDAMTLSPSSSSDTAVVKLIRSSSEICQTLNEIEEKKKKNKHEKIE